MPKIVNSEKLKVLLLTKIEEKKDILFGKFSDCLTKNDRCKAWQEVYEFGKSIGYGFSSDSTYAYVRDTVWPNIRKASVAKRDKLQRTGEGNEDGGLSAVDEKVINIIGNESAAVMGLSITESMDRTEKYCESAKIIEDTDMSISSVSNKKVAKKRISSMIDKDSTDDATPGTDEKRSLQIVNLKLSNAYLEKKLKLVDSLEYKAQLEIRLLQKQLADDGPAASITCNVRSETAPPVLAYEQPGSSENLYHYMY